MSDVVPREPTTPIGILKRDVEAVVTREFTMLDDRAKARMQSAAIVAVTKDPELLLADRQSFIAALRMCAQHNVIPDGNEAVLQVYNTKVKTPDGKESWIKKVTYLPMIRGIVNRVLRSGKISLFYAEVVHENEEFTVDTSKGDRRPIHHLDHFDRKGPIIGAYSVAKFQDGTIDCEPVSLAELEKIKGVAKTKNVWDQWFAEKAKVAAMKRHAKRLPLSSEDLEFILNRDETDFDQSPRDVTPAERTEARLSRIAQERRSAPETAETVLTGEVMPDDQEGPSYDDACVFPGDAAFTDGAKAFAAGMKEKHNPHKENPGYSNWLAGWMGARQAKENAQ